MNWKDVPGYEGLYKVSECGQVFSTYTDKKLLPNNIQGYRTVQLYKDGKRYAFRINRLVAMCWVDNPDPSKYTIVNHLNGITTDDNASNLEWTDNAGNSQHGANAKLNWQQVNEIRAKYVPRQYTMLMLSEEYGVGKSVIHDIIHYKSWKK